MSSDTGGVSAVKRVRNKQIIFLVLPILLLFTVCLPGAWSEKDNESDDETETFSQSPTNHEKVLSKKKQAQANNGNDDYWVGSHQLEFKPHPLLMPSTQAPNDQIPIPLIEMGNPPTTVPTILTDDNLEASSEEQKKKVKQGKSRDRRKKSRNQRRLNHRTFWANSSSNGAYLMSLHRQSKLLPNQYYLQQQNHQQQPVILTSPISNSLYTSPTQAAQSTQSAENFHGTSTTWNINHPGNSQPRHVSGQIANQENQIIQGYPQTYPHLQQLQFGYPQLGQTQFFPQQYPPSSLLTAAHQTMSISPSAPDTFADSMLMNSNLVPNHMTQMSFGQGNGKGPVIVYIPAGKPQSLASASMPITAYNQFNPNEIPMGYNHKLPYPITGPGPTGVSSHSSGKPQTNPQFLRNNFLRMFMDKLANVGKVLPIPFVTKYSSSQNTQPGYNGGHSQYHRRM